MPTYRPWKLQAGFAGDAPTGAQIFPWTSRCIRFAASTNRRQARSRKASMRSRSWSLGSCSSSLPLLVSALHGRRSCPCRDWRSFQDRPSVRAHWSCCRRRRGRAASPHPSDAYSRPATCQSPHRAHHAHRERCSRPSPTYRAWHNWRRRQSACRAAARCRPGLEKICTVRRHCPASLARALERRGLRLSQRSQAKRTPAPSRTATSPLLLSQQARHQTDMARGPISAHPPAVRFDPDPRMARH